MLVNDLEECSSIKLSTICNDNKFITSNFNNECKNFMLLNILNIFDL